MLLNQERAQEILAREQLDGLVAQLPINVYYLSDYWGLFNTAGGYDAAYMAVLPRDSAQAGLVVPALELRRIATKGTWMPNIFGHSSPNGEALLEDGTARGVEYVGWRAADGADLTELEHRWVDIVARLGNEMSADAFWAVAHALKAAGLDHGRIATDEPRLAGWLAACGLDRIRCEYRVDLFNEIRLVKTPAELELMKIAARSNETGLLAAVDAMRDGITWHELENVYMMTMARQGARGVYLTCGVGELPAGHVRAGEPVLFDALGQYEHYHGDFGRCAVVGEPAAEHRRRHAAICTGWKVAQEYLKPGVRYSDLSAAVGAAVRADGFAGFRDPVVHSLGLEHTDDPKSPGVQPQDKPDRTLLQGMVVNVDMPHTEIGWGSVHMEDTVVITDDGCERLASADFDLRVV
ncbi:MAG: M24 family metallopeptidase [Gammaproteobacteria bacterium]